MDGREMDWRGIFPCAFHALAIMFCYNTENTRSLGVRHLLDRLSSWVVRARRGILAVFLILGVLSAFLMAAVQVNYDLTAYLPQDMPTTKALTLMDDTFGYTGMAQVMLEDMSIDEILEMKAQIAAVDGVRAAEQVMRSVIWVMILPLRAAPAPENTMTPTRERLADVP